MAVLDPTVPPICEGRGSGKMLSVSYISRWGEESIDAAIAKLLWPFVIRNCRRCWTLAPFNSNDATELCDLICSLNCSFLHICSTYRLVLCFITYSDTQQMIDTVEFRTIVDLDSVPFVQLGTSGSSLSPSRLVSCAMSSSGVAFFARRLLESMLRNCNSGREVKW